MKYALNTGLPRGDYSGPLKTIVEKHGLSRDQIRLQLKNYKDATFGLLQVKLIFDFDSLREKLQEALGMEQQEFVSRFVSKMINWSSSRNNFNNFAKVIEGFPNSTIDFLRSVRDPQSSVVFFLPVVMTTQSNLLWRNFRRQLPDDFCHPKYSF